MINELNFSSRSNTAQDLCPGLRHFEWQQKWENTFEELEKSFKKKVSLIRKLNEQFSDCNSIGSCAFQFGRFEALNGRGRAERVRPEISEL